MNVFAGSSSLHPEHGLIGNSLLMAEVRSFIGRAARANPTVLIQGESGTGKELVARALHQTSSRSGGPFIAVNCAALPENLLEDELFGHERGAFTGAHSQRKGKFELASGGTLFLDEAGELTLSIQAKLLRAIEQREIDRLGGTRPVPVDIRLIAATNCDLECAVNDGRFREDLYYRLNVLTVRTPALRDRPKDIPALIRHFIAMYGKTVEPPVQSISAEAESILCGYGWPGNVRELQNVIQRGVVLSSGDTIQAQDLQLTEVANPSEPAQPREVPTLEEILQNARRQSVIQALEQNRGNSARAAAQLGIHRRTLYRFIRRFDLSHLCPNSRFKPESRAAAC